MTRLGWSAKRPATRAGHLPNALRTDSDESYHDFPAVAPIVVGSVVRVHSQGALTDEH